MFFGSTVYVNTTYTRFKNFFDMYNYNSNVLIHNTELSPLGGISLAGTSIQGVGVLEKERILHSYSLVYLFGGSGRYRDETGIDIAIKPGDLIQIHPDISHWYGPDKGQVWDEVYIIFEGEIFDLWYKQKCFDLSKKVINLSPMEYWRDRFFRACGVERNDDPNNAISSVVKLQQILADVHRATEVDSSKNKNWLEHAKAVLAKENDSHRAAENIGMNYETFRKKFKKVYGLPPQQYIIHHTMEKARSILREETSPIHEIASRLGYCDEFHFSKQFAKVVGCSPSAYRNMAMRDRL